MIFDHYIIYILYYIIYICRDLAEITKYNQEKAKYYFYYLILANLISRLFWSELLFKRPQNQNIRCKLELYI